MLGVHVTVPIACFRKGMAREYLETEEIPPPSTCYGFLLSLVGETDRHRHIGCCVAPAVIAKPELSTVLRTIWRVKSRPLGSSGNTRPDYQQLLTGIELVIWLDSTGEADGMQQVLESRVVDALDPAQRGNISRFGGLSLGESTHLVDSVAMLTSDLRQAILNDATKATRRIFVCTDHGRLSLPVWVDHVGSAGTQHVVGDLVETDLSAPDPARMPRIYPPGV